MRSKRRPETSTHKVTGHTLREALGNARRQYGDRACVVDTRTVVRREENGLGSTRLIEVAVALPETVATPAPAGPQSDSRTGYAQAIGAEVGRIEDLIETLRAGRNRPAGTDKTAIGDYPLGRQLLASGASLPAVRHLQRLYQAETRGDDTPESSRKHLAGLMRTSGGSWRDLAGCHLFLGGPGAGKTDLVLSVAARLKEMRRRILVLSYAPRHGGEVRRLQDEASAQGYDAAILRDATQLSGGLDYFEQYDAVLIDTPSLGGGDPADAELHRVLADQEDVHRHLLLPVDADLTERERAWEQARSWNCDWLALTRLDLTTRAGKLVDILLAAPMPLSLISGGAWPGPGAEIAAPARLLARILDDAPSADVATATVEATAS